MLQLSLSQVQLISPKATWEHSPTWPSKSSAAKVVRVSPTFLLHRAHPICVTHPVLSPSN